MMKNGNSHTGRARLVLTVLALVVAGATAQADIESDGTASKDGQLRNLLDMAIERGAPLYDRGDPDACLAVYELTARTALTLGEDVLAEADRESLRRGLDAAAKEHDVRRGAWALRRAFDEILARGQAVETPVVKEASLPEGFPGAGPVGEVVVKTYPAYRMARSNGGRMAFWKLFSHIKANDIAMTAPVEMTMTPGRNGDFRMSRMAFLYASTDLGRTGTQGDVEVVDVPAARVLSIGLMGPLTAERIRAAREAIEARIGPGELWERDGDWRVMGYNSPMVPESKRFHELQLPVRLAVGD